MKKQSPKSDAAEIKRRRKAAEDYDALCRFEGIKLSADMCQEIEQLVNGEVTPAQCRAIIIRKLTTI